jgi:hypothetical protein
LNGTFNHRLLAHADKLHDLLAGNKEFNLSREAIKDDSLHDYFQTHEYSRDKITPPNEENL